MPQFTHLDLMDRVARRMVELEGLYESPLDYLDSQAEDLGKATAATLDNKTGQGFMAGFIAGQEWSAMVQEDAPAVPSDPGELTAGSSEG